MNKRPDASSVNYGRNVEQWCGMIYHTPPGEPLLDPPPTSVGGRA
jgi:hypothetical protein